MDPKEKQKSNYTYSLRSIFVGSIAAMSDLIITHPLQMIKSKQQSNEKISWNIRALYKDIGANVLSMVPVTATRVMLANVFYNYFFEIDQPTNHAKIITSFLGGATTTFISTPAELLIRRQTYKKLSLGLSVSSLYQNHGLKHFMLGGTAIAGQGGLYTVGFYAATPIITDWMNTLYPNCPRNILLTVSGAITGFTISCITHPLDTIKNIQHKKGGDRFVSIREAFKQGITNGLFHGVWVRATRLAISTVLLSTIIEKLENWFTKKAPTSSPPKAFQPTYNNYDYDSHKPLIQFNEWYVEAKKAESKPYAMVLSTVSKEGKPSSRVVAYQYLNEGNFVFFTNYESKKAQDIATNPHVSLLFFWPNLYRQIRIEGTVEKVEQEESEAYFATRARPKQIMSTISQQSALLIDSDDLNAQYKIVDAQEGNKIPCPIYWGGYRVKPNRFEFWCGSDERNHERLVYELDEDLDEDTETPKWKIYKLQP